MPVLAMVFLLISALLSGAVMLGAPNSPRFNLSGAAMFFLALAFLVERWK